MNDDMWASPHTRGALSVKFVPGVSLDAPEVNSLISMCGASLHEDLTSFLITIGVHHFMFDDGDDPAREFADEAVRRGLAEYALPDPNVEVSAIPNDPGYPGNGGIGGTEQYYLTQIGMTAAYDLSQGSPTVVIASLDTHFYLAHPDMAGKFTSNGYNFTSSSSTLNTPSDCSDTLFHGCLTTAIACAATNNAAGMAGVAPNCLVMPMQCASNNTGASPSVSLTQATAGALLATSQGAKVITMSFCGLTNYFPFGTALSQAWDAGLVLCGGLSDDGNQFVNGWPASYPNVIAIGSVDQSDARSSFSAFGKFCNCAAPGNATFVTANYDGGYTTGYQGCSYSTPIVAAVAALMFSINPMINNKQIYGILTSSAGGDPTTGFTNSTVYRVNAQKALLAAQALNPWVKGSQSLRYA